MSTPSVLPLDSSSSRSSVDPAQHKQLRRVISRGVVDDMIVRDGSGGKLNDKLDQQLHPRVVTSIDLAFRPAKDSSIPNPRDLDPSAPLIGDVTKSTTSSASNELHFYVACGKYKHEIKVKDIADKREADKLYADVKVIISRKDGYKDYEIESIDVFNQKVIVKRGTDKKEIDLKKEDKNLAKNLQNLFDKVLEKALGSNGSTCQWPKIYKTAAGPINAGPWFQPKSSEMIKKLKKISAIQFVDLKMRSNPSMTEEQGRAIFDRMDTAEKVIKKLKEDTAAKLLEQKTEKEMLKGQLDFDENDQAYKALEVSIVALEGFVKELDSLDMFALFSILYSKPARSDAEKIALVNEHVEDILNGFGGNRKLIPDSHKMYARQVAVAAQMTNRIDCSMLCKAQQIEPMSDPLEWVLAQYVLREESPGEFFAHPRITRLIGEGPLASDLFRPIIRAALDSAASAST